mmetsp:Transcript_37146/g.90296  ORF Transcript_37146/g.90296 Transcript_37146/m.90296 type:complete len:261 (-) Transcript_37146:30-812(-)
MRGIRRCHLFLPPLSGAAFFFVRCCQLLCCHLFSLVVVLSAFDAGHDLVRDNESYADGSENVVEQRNEREALFQGALFFPRRRVLNDEVGVRQLRGIHSVDGQEISQNSVGGQDVVALVDLTPERDGGHVHCRPGLQDKHQEQKKISQEEVSLVGNGSASLPLHGQGGGFDQDIVRIHVFLRKAEGFHGRCQLFEFRHAGSHGLGHAPCLGNHLGHATCLFFLLAQVVAHDGGRNSRMLTHAERLEEGNQWKRETERGLV